MSISRVVAEIDEQLALCDEERDRLLAARAALVGPTAAAPKKRDESFHAVYVPLPERPVVSPEPSPEEDASPRKDTLRFPPKRAPTIEPDEDLNAQPDDSDPEPEPDEEDERDDESGEVQDDDDDAPNVRTGKAPTAADAFRAVMADGCERNAEELVAAVQQRGIRATRENAWAFITQGIRRGLYERISRGRWRAKGGKRRGAA